MGTPVKTQVSGNTASGDAMQINAPIAGNVTNTYNFSQNSFFQLGATSKTDEIRRQECLSAMLLTKATGGSNIPYGRGRPSRGTCQWIKSTEEYQHWRGGETKNLRIVGDAGKGKTFLAMNLIKDLEENEESSATMILRYFCNSTDNQRRTADAVLTGYLYQLLEGGKWPSVTDEILLKFNTWHKDLFTRSHRQNLFDTFEKAIRKISGQIYIVLDGLDECEKDSIDFLEERIDLWTTDSAKDLRLRTAVISREPSKNLGNVSQIDLSNHTRETKYDILYHIHQHAVMNLYCQKGITTDRLARLREDNQLDELDKISPLYALLLERANGRFLWIALALDTLNKEDIDRILESNDYADKLLPEELPHMIDRILLEAIELRNIGSSGAKPEDVVTIIRLVSLAFRPLTVAELRATAGNISEESIRRCRHVLSLPGDKIQDDTELRLVHESLRDLLLNPHGMLSPHIARVIGPYLLPSLGSILEWPSPTPRDSILFASLLAAGLRLLFQYSVIALIFIGISVFVFWRYTDTRSFLEKFEHSLKLSIFNTDERKAHGDLLVRCLDLLDGKTPHNPGLEKDICRLQRPNALPPKVTEQKLLRPMEYACRYWVEHLCQADKPLCYNTKVLDFLQNRFIYWLEALSLMNTVPYVIDALEDLQSIFSADESSELHAFLEDAVRFVLRNRSMIERAPLQLYCSALLFAPKESVVRKQFMKLVPKWIQRKSDFEENWGFELQRFRVYLDRHASRRASFAISKDGTTVASGLRVLRPYFTDIGRVLVSTETAVRLWDADTGAPRRHADRKEPLVLEGHVDGIASLAFSLDGETVASGSYDKTVRLWDANTGEPRRYADTQEPLVLEGHTGIVASVTFSPDGKTVASGSDDNTARLWDAYTGAPLLLEGHRASISSVVFSPAGKTVASGSFDNTVRLWDASTGAPRQYPNAKKPLVLEGHIHGVASVTFSPDGNTIASGSFGGTVRLWDASTGAPRQHADTKEPLVLKGHILGVASVTFSPDGSTIASGSSDKTVRLWDASTGTPRQHANTEKPLVLEGHTSPIVLVAYKGFENDKKLISCSRDMTVRFWDVDTKAPQYEYEVHTDRISSVVISPDGNTIASGSYDKTVRLWDASTGAPRKHADKKEPLVLKGHIDGVALVTFSPDGNTIASGSFDKTVRLWDASTGTPRQHPNTKEPLVLEGHTDIVTSVTFSPDGKTIASGSWDKTVRLWDASTGALRQHSNTKEPPLVLEGHILGVALVTFSPDGSTIASGSSDMTVRLWDASTGAPRQYPDTKEPLVLKGHVDSITSLAFSPDGNTIASGSYDKTVRLWDASTGAPRRHADTRKPLEYRGHGHKVTYIAFSPDGKTIVSGSLKHGFKHCWNAYTGERLLEYKGHSDQARFSLSPTGWIMEDQEEILYLLEMASKIAVWNGTVALADLLGRITILEFAPGPKLISV
ncbi:hypothetical protein MMC07_008192 [Pseudocyphellaria aurata]|nr:hypothetical protein [Pseudocyphellaria aurata]